jgi:phenylacetate-CoA ligase
MPSLLDFAKSAVAGVGWPPMVEGDTATLLALVRHLEASQWHDADSLQAKQFVQLGILAPWLAAHSPAFARRLAAGGLAPQDLASPAGLAALPIVDRRWFREEPNVDCDAVPAGHEPVGTNVTSGSTGEFLRVKRTRVSQLVWLAMMLRDHAWRRTDFAVPLATTKAPNPGIRRYPNWGAPANLLFETGPALTLPVSLPGDELFDLLADFETGNLLIYPNALRVLLAAAEARGVRLDNLRAIRTVGEVVDDALRKRAGEILGVPIADAYTSQEAGYIALECPETGLYHSMSEALIVEVLRPDGTPCGAGETGTVVITDLHNHATPVVRYALGDLAEVNAPCACGRGLPTLRRIVGRSRNLIRLPDGNRVWPSLGGFGPEGYLHVVPILQFQLIQTEPDLLEIRLVTERPLTADEERLINDRTCRSLGHPFRLVFRYFDGRLPLPPSGKFEDFICLV